MGLLERLLKYVAIDTQSDPASDAYPSTRKQFDLLNLLAGEMTAMGLNDVRVDKYGYTTATILATRGMEDRPVIGFIAHVDTTPDMSGTNVRPHVVVNYDGGDIALKGAGLTLSPREFPELARYKGHTLITTDGTTLLGADDKAGVAEIMTAAEYLIQHPEIPHGCIRIAFTPDEEIGRGVDHFDVAEFGARFAYTIDGSVEGELEYENFNAAEAKIAIHGRNIHPGYAKGKMINALHVAGELDAMLPAAERPEHTEGCEGFFHLTSLCGTPDGAAMEYIIRDHSREEFERRKALIAQAAGALNSRYGAGTVDLAVRDQYYNMREMVEPHPAVIARAEQAMREAGVAPVIKPIRGGTDGARLSYMGLPCPNIFAGGINFHGRYEFASLEVMEKAVQTIVNLARIWAE